MVDLLIAFLKDETLDRHVWEYMYKAKYKDGQHLSTIIETFEKLTTSYDTPSTPQAIFWKNYITFLQGLTNMNEAVLRDMAHVSPFHIENIVDNTSRDLGAEGKHIVQCSADCIKKRAEAADATELDKAESKFAEALLTIYKAVNGENMHSLYFSPPSEHYLTVDAQVVADFLRSHTEISRLNNWPFTKFDVIKNFEIIPFVNSKYLDELKDRRDNKLGYLPNVMNNISEPDEILNSYSVDIAILPKLLEACAVNKLINFFSWHLICEWTVIQPVSPVSLQDVTNSFVAASKDNFNETKKEHFITLCDSYLQTLQQNMLDEIKTLKN